jgi:hypothetical protein
MEWACVHGSCVGAYPFRKTTQIGCFRFAHFKELISGKPDISVHFSGICARGADLTFATPNRESAKRMSNPSSTSTYDLLVVLLILTFVKEHAARDANVRIGPLVRRDSTLPATVLVECGGFEGHRYGPLAGRVALGASSFSLFKASGIMRPNKELSSAVGIRPPLFSWPCCPAIRNCGTSG